jgi:hypothetical protein
MALLPGSGSQVRAGIGGETGKVSGKLVCLCRLRVARSNLRGCLVCFNCSMTAARFTIVNVDRGLCKS